MNKLYKDLYLEAEKKGYDLANEKSKEIYRQQRKDREELLNKIGRVIISYTVLDAMLSIGDRDEKNLTKEFSAIVNNIAKNQYRTEKTITNDILSTVTHDKYYKDAYLLNIGMDFNLKKLTDKQIKGIVNGEIKGTSWSDRIWKNKGQLERTLIKEVNHFFDGDTSINKIEKNIRNRFNQNAYNTKRLLETEVCRCQNEVNNVFAEEHNIEKQMYCATLDNRTCQSCAEDDGKIYDINDIDKPDLPRHPLDRCCYINMPSDNWKPKQKIQLIMKIIISGLKKKK